MEYTSRRIREARSRYVHENRTKNTIPWRALTILSAKRTESQARVEPICTRLDVIVAINLLCPGHHNPLRARLKVSIRLWHSNSLVLTNVTVQEHEFGNLGAAEQAPFLCHTKRMTLQPSRRDSAATEGSLLSSTRHIMAATRPAAMGSTVRRVSMLLVASYVLDWLVIM